MTVHDKTMSNISAGCIFGAAFLVGLGVGANMASDDTTVKDEAEVVATNTEPVHYNDVLCNAEDEIAVVVTDNGFDHEIGERFCVHVDDLVTRKG